MDQTIRILHLEDDPVEQELVERQLRLAGLHCEWRRVASEPDFENAIAAGEHDLILCDCKIPGYDGRTAVIRAHETCPEIPLIVLTGALGDGEGVDYLKEGAWDLVFKQHPERLPYVVARALEQASGAHRRKQVEAALRAIADTSVSSRVGVDILHQYLEHLSGILGAEYAFVGLIEGEQRNRVRIRAAWPHIGVPDDFEYPLLGSPCSKVVTAGSEFQTEFVSVESCVIMGPLAHFGSKTWMAVPLVNSARVPVGMLVCLSGISLPEADRRQNVLRIFAGPIASELRRERSERRYQQLFEFAPDAIVMTDHQGRIMALNRQAEVLFGWTRTELLGQPVTMLAPESSQANLIDLQGSFLRPTGSSTLGDDRSSLRGLSKNGREFPAEVSLCPMESDDGMLFAAAIRDVTDRERVMSDLERAAQELRAANLQIEGQHDRLVEAVAKRTAELTTANAQLEKAKTDAEQANRAKSSFLAAMSHEIRTPMNGVIGTADILAHSPLSKEQAELLSIIQRSAGILLRIIDEILDFSKIEAGRLEIEHAPVSVRDVIEGLCTSLSPVAERGGVDLALFVSPGLPESVLTDAVRLHQVLYNLIGNAIKFSGSRTGRRGHVSIRVTAVRASPLLLSFAVTDDGIGMNPQVLNRLFTAFTQAEMSTTRRFGGTGLGLAICKRLVELMQGEIDVSSTPGVGSNFTVKLPFEVAAVEAADPPPDLSGLRCIVLDSPEFNAGDVREYLENAGAHVHLIADSSAVTRFAAGMPGAVVIAGHSNRRFLEALNNTTILKNGILRRDALLRNVTVAAGCDAAATYAEETVQTQLLPNGGLLAGADDARAAGRLILVAEDDDINQSVISQQLKLLGYTAEFASNGAEALNRWRVGGYGLVLSDLDMPEMDGYALTAAIRREEAAKGRTPILALTANALRGEARRAHEAGMDDYLSKPIRLDALGRALQKWLPISVEAPNRSDSVGVANTPDTPVSVDVAVLGAVVGDDPKIVRGLLVDYLAAIRRMGPEFCAAVEGRDFTRMSSIAHRLKSSSRSVGAMPLGTICEALESASKAGQTVFIVQHMREFESILAQVDACISALLDERVSDKRSPGYERST